MALSTPEIRFESCQCGCFWIDHNDGHKKWWYFFLHFNTVSTGTCQNCTCHRYRPNGYMPWSRLMYRKDNREVIREIREWI